MDENLIQAGQTALEQSESLRTAQAKRAKQQRRTGQQQASYVRTDAEQGLIEVQDVYGGRSLISNQGSLSNRAIAPGDSVRLYQDEKSSGWQSVDWKPVAIAQRVIEQQTIEQRVIRPTTIRPSAPSPPTPSVPAPPAPKSYCSTQCFWYKGMGSKYPAEGEPPQPGQCDGLYSGSWNWEFLQSVGGGALWRQAGGYFDNVLAPIEIDVVQPGQTDATGSTSALPSARLTYFYIDGDGQRVAGATNYEIFGFAMTGNQGGAGRPRSIQFCRGPRVTTNQGPDAGSSAPSIRTYPVTGSIPRDANDRFASGCALDAQPDNCGGTPPYGPPTNSDPNKWQAICSINPPIRFDFERSSDRSRITIWDQLTTKATPLAILDFEKGRFSYSVRCAEEGPP
jgi:hypothetical protein